MNQNKALDGKKVGLLCQYFPPEEGAAPARMSFFKYWLEYSGANITILTSMPNYPHGIIHKKYSGKVWCKESDGINTILRTWVYSRPIRSTLNRLLNYFTFMILSLRWTFKLKDCDIIIFSSGPMFAGLAAFVAKKLFKTKVILDARDLWPDRIWESGAIKLPKWVLKILHAYESFMYKNVVAITCATQGVADAIQSRITTNIPVIVVRNCDQETSEHTLPVIEKERQGNDITVIEAGTIGWAQDPETLCDAFEQVSIGTEYKATLKFAGDGPRVEKLKSDINNTDADISYAGHLAKNNYWEFLHEADIGVVTLQASEHNLMTVSRRVYDYAKAGLAIIYCGSGEGANLVKSADAGLVVDPGNSKALSEALKILINTPEELMKWKNNSSNLLSGELSAKSVSDKLIQIVNNVID